MLFRVYILTYCMTASLQFGIKEMDMPTQVALGSIALLSCKIDSRDVHQLHSIKWYKDDVELCSFTPLEEPAVRNFSISGIADKIHCRNDSVEMRNVSIHASGVYKCEASTSFETVVNSRNISVMVYPTKDPLITGLRDFYNRGDKIEAKCSSSPSNPPPKLRWFLNGIANNRFIANDVVEAVEPEGLFKRSQELHLIAHPELFLNSRLTLMCESTLPDLPPWRVLAKVTLRSTTEGVPSQTEGKTRKAGSGRTSCASGNCPLKSRGCFKAVPFSLLASVVPAFFHWTLFKN